MEAGGNLSLGDILAAAFAAVPAEPHPGLLEIETARLFASVVADHYGFDWVDAWSVLCSVPDEHLGGLKTASGWTALAAIIAKELGTGGDPLLVSVH